MHALKHFFTKNILYPVALGLVFILINTALTYYEYQNQMTFSLDNTAFTFVSLTHEEMVLRDQEGDKVRVYLDELAARNHFYPLRGAYKVTYKDIVIEVTDIEKGVRQAVTKDGDKFNNYRVQKESFTANTFEENLVIEIGQLYAIVRGYGLKALYVSNSLILLVLILINQPFSTKDKDLETSRFEKLWIVTFTVTVIILFQLNTITYQGKILKDLMRLFLRT